VPNPNDGCRLRYDKNLDRSDIRLGVERILNNIKSLLEEAGRVDERYGLKSNVSRGSEVSASKGIDIFKGSFERFKSRIRKHQKETSAWKVTRWAIHDANKFEGMLNRLKEFVDGLESITKSLGLLQDQHKRLRQEIESISDTQSLRLLRDASSRHGSSQREISDAASQRLITVAESFIATQTLDFSSHFSATIDSFVTARSKPTPVSGSLLDEEQHIPGAFPGSLKSASRAQHQRGSTSKNRSRGISKPSASCEQCIEEHYKCVPPAEGGNCSRCVQTKRGCSFELVSMVADPETASVPPNIDSIPAPLPEPLTLQELPQHQRLLSDLIGKAKPRKPLSFAAGDAHYGERLASIKTDDEKYWLDHSGKILGHANGGSSAAKRMFIELRNIRAGKVPFVSAVPLDDNLAKVLGSIEGPPETPYEGGVFFITIKLSETDPFGPPLMRFHTKIYHPNISPQGHICADYKEKWNSVLSAGTTKAPVSDSSALWYPAKSRDTQWSLGALLTALCGLLATPDVDDPLVPEIAQKYLEDYDGYCENARLYTKRFATGPRPEHEDLVFSEELPLIASEMVSLDFDKSRPESVLDTISLPDSLRPIHYETAESVIAAAPKAFDDEAMPSPHSFPESYLALHNRLKGGRLASRWIAIRSNAKPENRNAVASSATDLADLILITRDTLRTLTIQERVIMEFDGTDLEICYGLLEKAILSIRLRHRETISAFYDTVQVLCGNYLIDWLAHGCTDVQVVSDLSSTTALYQITIVVEADNEHKKWVFTRDWDEIKAFNNVLISEIPDAELFDLERSSNRYEELTFLNPLVVAAFLEYGLKRVFSSHARELLKLAEVLRFLRPENRLRSASEDVPGEGAMVAVPRSLPGANTLPFNGASFLPFIPSSLLVGINCFALPSLPWVLHGRRFKFFISFSHHYDVGWAVEGVEAYSRVLMDGSPINQILKIDLTSSVTPPRLFQKGLILEVSQRRAGCTVLSITYRIDKSEKTLRIMFNTSTEAQLCFDTLQVLRRVDELIRPSSVSS
jgi:ubiquitin-protein ligase